MSGLMAWQNSTDHNDSVRRSSEVYRIHGTPAFNLSRHCKQGIGFHRSIYTPANLRIRLEKKAALVDVPSEIIKPKGEDPGKYLKPEFMAGRTIVTEKDEAEIYARALWETLRKDMMGTLNISSGEQSLY